MYDIHVKSKLTGETLFIHTMAVDPGPLEVEVGLHVEPEADVNHFTERNRDDDGNGELVADREPPSDG